MTIWKSKTIKAQKVTAGLHSLHSVVMCLSSQYLMKYGKAIKTMPKKIIRNTLETKYGNAHRTIPDRRTRPRRCFLPYIIYPIPIEPNKTPHIIDDVLSIIFLNCFHLHITLRFTGG